MNNQTNSLPPVEEVFNPSSEAYSLDPRSTVYGLGRARGRLVFYPPWNAWIMTQMEDIMDCWQQEYLSSDFYDWEFAPERPAEDQWQNFERAMIGPQSTSRSRPSPIGTQGCVSGIFSAMWWRISSARIKPDIVKLLESLIDKKTFDYIEEVATNIPFISITRMIRFAPKNTGREFKTGSHGTLPKPGTRPFLMKKGKRPGNQVTAPLILFKRCLKKGANNPRKMTSSA